MSAPQGGNPYGMYGAYGTAATNTAYGGAYGAGVTGYGAYTQPQPQPQPQPQSQPQPQPQPQPPIPQPYYSHQAQAPPQQPPQQLPYPQQPPSVRQAPTTFQQPDESYAGYANNAYRQPPHPSSANASTSKAYGATYNEQQQVAPQSAPPQPENQPQRQPAPAAISAVGSGSFGQRRYAHPVPDRFVKIESSPTPARDIRYTNVPAEVYNSDPVQHMSAVDFIGIDDGNANPKFFRATTSNVPTEQAQVKDTLIPFGATLSPLCLPLHSQELVPVVSDRPPVRCTRCRAYLSCHAKFMGGGWEWVCPLCEMTNAVEKKFFANVDAKGRRVDRAEKPELCLGSVEYNVDAYPEYQLKNEKDEVLPTRPLHHLFLLDVSAHAIRTFLPAYVEALYEALNRMAELTPYCKVSFITYASKLHFYDFHDPRMPQYVVPDVNNPFVPLPFTTLCWLEVGKDIEVIHEFLGRVMSIASGMREVGCAVGAAVQVATLVFAGQHGGRAVIAAHSHPQTGVGAVKLRDQHKLYGTDREKELMRPIEGFWTTTAIEAAKQQISFDLFIFPTEYCELVTMLQLSRMTNGRAFLFPNYDPQVDGTKVKALMGQVATEEAGYAGILRVRCSNNLRVRRYCGHYLSQTVSDMDLASISGSSTFYVEFEHEGVLEKNSNVYFQVALLYTTRSGSRRVRVQSVRLQTSTDISKVYHGCDLEAVLVGILHDAVSYTVNKGPKHVGTMLLERLSSILINYRRFGSSEGARKTKSLLMPARLKLLSIYILCLCKSDAMAEGTTTRIDERIYSLYELMSMPMQKLCSYLYPSLFSLEQLALDSTYGFLNEVTGLCNLPPREQLVYDTVYTDGVYALCDEQALVVYLWIGKDVSASVSEALFGVPDARRVCRADGPGTECFSERLQNVLYALTLKEDGMRRLVVIHQGESAEDAFFKQLKEESTGPHHMSYDVFLSQVHRKVREALA